MLFRAFGWSAVTARLAALPVQVLISDFTVFLAGNVHCRLPGVCAVPLSA
jgi:hypothetical protein